MQKDQKLDLKLPANRCPYCHEDVAAEENVVCQSCLARHHPACWSEAGCCSACGGEQQMTASRPPLTKERATAILLERGYSEDEVDALLASRSKGGLGGIVLTAFILVAAAILAAGVGIVAGITLDTIGLPEREAFFVGVGTAAAVFPIVLLRILLRRHG